MTTSTKSAATASTLDHHHLAADLDAAHRHGVALDRQLRRAGLVTWMDPARRESLALLEHLHRLRIELDRLAGGPDAGTPYVLRCPAVVALSAPAAVNRGSLLGTPPTGDDDCAASVLEGDHKGASSATPAAPAPPGDLAELDHAHEAEAHTEQLQAAPMAERMDV